MFNVLHIHRRLIGCKDHLFAILVQVIKDVKKDVLGTGFSREELHVVNDQNIDQLVKVNKVVSRILFDRLNVLLCKLLGRNIEYGPFGVLILNLDPDGMCQMGFSKTDAAKNQ